MTKKNPKFEKLHDEAYLNKARILAHPHGMNGCFYCLEVFYNNKIKDWTDNGETALCPKCKNDTVLGSRDRTDILNDMREYWFGEKLDLPPKPEFRSMADVLMSNYSEIFNKEMARLIGILKGEKK